MEGGSGFCFLKVVLVIVFLARREGEVDWHVRLMMCQRLSFVKTVIQILNRLVGSFCPGTFFHKVRMS